MAEEYGIIEPVTEHPVRKLLVVPHREKPLTLAFPAFGPNYFSKNIEEMAKTYSHPRTGEDITFKPATTSESISAVSFNVANTMITNFHAPESTLYMMVCAFGGHDFMVEAYQKAIKDKYRFLTFGDAMLIL